MNLQNIAIQFAFLYAPFVHTPVEQVTPTLFRGQDPKVAEIQKLHNQGIKTIISLRTNPETKKKELCDKLGMKWINIKTGVFQVPTPEQFDEFRQIIKDPANQPTYASCEIDMDRTGVYIAAYRLVDQHWTIQQMNEEFSHYHQKKWWPIFRKYQSKVIAYAKQRLEAQGQEIATKPAPITPIEASEAKVTPTVSGEIQKKKAMPEHMKSVSTDEKQKEQKQIEQ